ncbi:MAG: hypothetical protein AAGA78_02410 [Pseudomonadota bacterium]
MSDEKDQKQEEFGEINEVIAGIRALVEAESTDSGDEEAPRKFNTLQLTSGDRLSEEEAQAALDHARAVVAAQIQRDQAEGADPIWTDVTQSETETAPPPIAKPAAKRSSRFAPGTAMNPQRPQSTASAGRLPRSVPNPALSVSQPAAPLDRSMLKEVLRDVVREELAPAVAKALDQAARSRTNRPVSPGPRKPRG